MEEYSKIGTPARPLRTANNLLNSLPSYHQLKLVLAKNSQSHEDE